MNDENEYALPYDSREIEQEEGETAREHFWRVLNNFPFYFRCGNFPNKTAKPEGSYRAQISLVNSWDEKSFPSEEEGYRVHSQKRLGQTYREFFAELERVVAELGLEENKIAEIVNDALYTEDNFSSQEERWKRMWDALIPIYVALRKQGYWKYDIIE